MIPRLKELYIKKIRPSMKEKFGYKNFNMAPKLEKVVLNMGLGIDGNDQKILKSCEEDLAPATELATSGEPRLAEELLGMWVA